MYDRWCPSVSLSVLLLQLQHLWTDIDEIWYEVHTFGGNLTPILLMKTSVLLRRAIWQKRTDVSAVLAASVMRTISARCNSSIPRLLFLASGSLS